MLISPIASFDAKEVVDLMILFDDEGNGLLRNSEARSAFVGRLLAGFIM